MKKIKNFIKAKGGLKVFLVSLALIIVALLCILVGVVYAYWGGEWNRIGEILSCDTAISVYIVAGLTIGALFFVTIILGRDKEVK